MKNSVKKVPFRFEKNVTQKSTLTSIKIIQPSICVVVALAPFYRLDFQDYFAPHSAKLTQLFLDYQHQILNFGKFELVLYKIKYEI